MKPKMPKMMVSRIGPSLSGGDDDEDDCGDNDEEDKHLHVSVSLLVRASGLTSVRKG